MKTQPVQLKKYGVLVWTNEMMDELRKNECLCVNCARLKPDSDSSDNCHIASAMYKIAVEENVAMAITRCPIWMPKT